VIEREAVVAFRVGWLALCFFFGVAGGFLSAELVGLPLVPLVVILLVRFARRGNMGVSTLLAYSAGFECTAVWVALPAIFPGSWATPTNRWEDLSLAAILLLLGLGIASAARLPAVRRRPGAV
jgi:hypothetical protein